MSVIFKDGDILSDLPVDEKIYIAHQVNCIGVMGAGLAKQLANAFPGLLDEYRNYINQSIFKSKEARYKLLGKVYEYVVNNNLSILNIFGQFGTYKYESGFVNTDYDALDAGFYYIRSTLPENSIVRIPSHIGCGLGGGDWGIVMKLIHGNFDDSSINLEIWKK